MSDKITTRVLYLLFLVAIAGISLGIPLRLMHKTTDRLVPHVQRIEAEGMEFLVFTNEKGMYVIQINE